MMRVRVCDDFPEIAEEWVAAVKAVVPQDFDVGRMETANDEVSTLLLRKIAVEKGEDPLVHATEFDEIDVLVVDYDLLHLDKTGGRTTGEGIARLARSLSKCGAIVVMNQYKGQFDLGMRGHLDSFADLNIDAPLVGRGPLWKQLEAAEGEFNPTTWTPMPVLLEAARKLAATLAEQGVEAAVTPLVGLGTAAIAELSDTAFGFLSLKAQTAEELAAVTVREFLQRSLDAPFVECLLAKAPDILFGFAAFRLVKWLDRAVFRPMDVLIDGPHLVDRLPFMIDPNKVDLNDAAAWARAASAPTTSLQWELLKGYHNELASNALGRTVFDWFRLANDDKVDEMQDAYLENEPIRYYLAEDTSRFVEKDVLIRYRADFHNFGDRRGIEKLADVTYGPLRRIRFG